MKKLLVIVDMQNDFVFGAFGSEAARVAVLKAAALITECTAEGYDLAFTLDTHGDDYPNTQEGRLLPVEHCKKNTAGWEVVPALAPFLKNAAVFEKGAFGSVSLAEFVKQNGYAEVTLCGVCTDICVVSNALLIKAHCPETRVKVVSEACAGTNEQNHACALNTMRSCQVIVK